MVPKGLNLRVYDRHACPRNEDTQLVVGAAVPVLVFGVQISQDEVVVVPFGVGEQAPGRLEKSIRSAVYTGDCVLPSESDGYCDDLSPCTGLYWSLFLPVWNIPAYEYRYSSVAYGGILTETFVPGNPDAMLRSEVGLCDRKDGRAVLGSNEFRCSDVPAKASDVPVYYRRVNHDESSWVFPQVGAGRSCL